MAISNGTSADLEPANCEGVPSEGASAAPAHSAATLRAASNDMFSFESPASLSSDEASLLSHPLITSNGTAINGDGGNPPRAPIPRPGTKWSVKQLRTALAEAGMSTSGKKETLFKRLNNAHLAQEEKKRLEAVAAAAASRPRRRRKPRHNAYLCFDVEATCMDGTGFRYPNEIIEFPVVVLRWEEDVDTSGDTEDSTYGVDAPPPARRLVVSDKFHSYVRPTWRPQLSQFCTDLTGIQQSMVDNAPTFPEVLENFEKWLTERGLLDGEELVRALWVTDGPWDLREFVPKQLHITPLDPPRHPRYLTGSYLDLKEAAAIALMGPVTTARRSQAKMPLTITDQVNLLGLGPFQGRQHSGIDDATNMARILAALADRDVIIEPNGRLPRKGRHYNWMGKPGEVIFDELADVASGDATKEEAAEGGAPEQASPVCEGEEEFTSKAVDLLAEDLEKMSLPPTATHSASATQPPQSAWIRSLWPRGTCTTV